MNKFYCDFCGKEINLEWDKVKAYKLEARIHHTQNGAVFDFDICNKCFEKLTSIIKLKSFNKD